MDASELADGVEQLVEAYRGALNIDPFFKINIEILDGDFVCECEKDSKSALAWTIKLNPSRHKDIYDIQYSTVEALINILFEPLGSADKDVKNGIVARLTEAFCNIIAGQSGSEDDDE